ncbi:hypothetical protein GGR58DRAFT_522157 [Xylaria digitata]|nr:hypothetical protein GGR58DRAFT_522157 [Xylaria digitata]
MSSYQSFSYRNFASNSQTFKSKVMSLIEQYYPSLLVVASQMVAATVNAAAKFCETRPERVHPFMILHIRMLITGLGCALYLSQLESSRSVAFFGIKEVRGLVLLRAIGGVVSATGFFFSMIYLTLSEAIALSFLSPLGSLILARCFSLGTIQWVDCVSAVGALVGVALVAQPKDIFHIDDTGSDASVKMHGHLKGWAFGLFGAFGGVIALTSIRRIGTRAHPLTSVNIFSWSVVFASGIALTMVSKIRWSWNPLIWACLIYIGICGSAMEYLLTVGISKDSSSAATLMMYTQIVWTLVVDLAFFHISANQLALVGAATIIGSLCLVTIVGGRKVDSVHKHLMVEEDEDAELLDINQMNL